MKSTSSVSTTPAGTAVTDGALVKNAPGAIAPTGLVRFILCNPGEVTAGGCTSPAGRRSARTAAGEQVGDLRPHQHQRHHNDRHILLARVRYLGDYNYNPKNHTDAGNECFTTF